MKLLSSIAGTNLPNERRTYKSCSEGIGSMTIPDWWSAQRRVSVVVDNPSWILPFAKQLVADVNSDGDHATLCRTHDEIVDGAAAFYLGCIHITPPDVLARNQRNLVVHASALPYGRGFSPLTWLTLEGSNSIPVCLLEAADDVDNGPVIYMEHIEFQGHELIDEMHDALGCKTLELCRRFLGERSPAIGLPQQGEPSIFRRRYPRDSELNVNESIAQQFNLLRVVDNERYPAFFNHCGHKYILRVEKWNDANDL